MFSTKTSLFFFFCVIAVVNASIRGLRNQLREQSDGEAAAYSNILSNLDSVTMEKIHQRFLMEKTAVRNDHRELQEVEGSESLSLSLSMPVPVLPSEFRSAEEASFPKFGKNGFNGRNLPFSKTGKRERRAI
ncbi:hypothetical protein IV203_020861 [Nitzschia inconspicua]|uniref:Uncharacterized protein n=1 Tax=Nitzschia inconspicua TaxID=303405 RepID=A0A9K3KGU9_9STRA|nr:hypothetical protein IV203_020861 [Nitzschia inconspicua]